MKNISTVKITVAMLLLTASFSAKAQSIKEADLKINVLAIEKPVEQLQQLEPIYYSFDTVKFPHLKLANSPQYGFRLQSAKSVFPDLIRANNKRYSAGKNRFKNATYQEIDNEHLVPILVAAIQEQQDAIKELRKEIERLKSEK